MGTLIVTDRNGVVSEHPLTKERTTIGRYSSNDIILNDAAVSGKHAVVVLSGADVFIEDLDSTNGTSVGGQPIDKQALADGDEISLGRNALRYVIPVAAAAASSKVSTKPVRGRLRVVSGALVGKELELTKTVTTVGKPGVLVAAITRRAEGYTIVQLSSAGASDGTRVNGLEIERDGRPLADKDRIELAGMQMEFALIEN